MTRYEYFEAWLTPKEWATWKRYSLRRFSQLYGHGTMNLIEARAKRKWYLCEEQVNLSTSRDINDEWDDMTNRLIRWADTPQGHSYWERVNARTRAVRVLPPMRALLNNAN